MVIDRHHLCILKVLECKITSSASLLSFLNVLLSLNLLFIYDSKLTSLD